MLARVYIVAVLVVFACSSNSKSNKDCEPDENGKCGEEKNNDAALQDAAVMPVWHVEPEVRITNDSEFTVMEGGLSKNSSQGEYMYGIYYMEYTGSELIVFVEVDITYKDREGNALYTENSFLWNDGYVELSVASTNSYATPDSPYLVLRIIEQLGEKGIQITDIDLIELAITSKQYDVMNPIYEPVTTGTINYVGDHKWQVIITNEQAKPIKDSSFGVFRDNNNRLGLWGSSQLFEETSTNTWERDDAILDSGQTGRLEIMKLQPDYLDDPLVLERILYGFLLELPESTASETNKIAPLPDLSRALSAEERDKAYLLWCSRQLRDQMSQLLLEKRD